MLFEACSGSDGLLGRAELSEVLWQDLQVLREGEVLTGPKEERYEKRRYEKHLIFGCFGGFPLHEPYNYIPEMFDDSKARKVAEIPASLVNPPTPTGNHGLKV